MGEFDDCITELTTCVGSIRGRSETQVRESCCPGPADGLLEGVPVAVGPGANIGVILRGDTFAELGNPDAGSCAALLWTDDLSLVEDGRIACFGPDIGEAQGASLPFAQVLVVAGSELGPDQHEALQQCQHISDRIEGYMARSTSEYVWSRVSNDAAAKGFDLEWLGRSLLYLVKTDVPAVEAAEVVLVTSSRDDVSAIAKVAATAKQISTRILSELWKSRGFDLDCDFDCSSCADEEVCDDIREVIVATKRKSLNVVAQGAR